jgi:hypothetical protein
MKTIKNGNGLVMEPNDSFQAIALHLSGKQIGFIVIPPDLRAEFQLSFHATSITQAVQEIHFEHFENNPRYSTGVTAFAAVINGKRSLVRICQNLGNGNFLVERVQDGAFFRVSGQHHVNSLIQVGQNPGWSQHSHLFKPA